MKKVDILFLYETKVRELENICLIKNELEERGYTVGVQNTWCSLGQKKRPYKAKVVVTHGMYHDGIYEFVKSLVGTAPKVVNMQCEQIGTVADEQDDNSRFILHGVSNQCMNICWGDRTVKRLAEKSKIDSKHLKKTGHVTLDFCREDLRGYYLSRDEIFAKYGIPSNLEVNLFISSFAYVNLPDDIEKSSDMLNKEHFISFSKQSFKGILSWFTQLLDTHPEQAIVYRPHPAEANNAELIELSNKFAGRFFVISDLSVKQWVCVSNRVYTWYSTSAAEVYMFGVPCAILRPVQIMPHMELALFEGASFITEYSDFEASVANGLQSSISSETFHQYYSVEQVPSYIRVADAIEEVFDDDSFMIKYSSAKKRKGFGARCRSLVYKILVGVKSVLPKGCKLLDKYKKKLPDEYTLQLQQRNYASDTEIKEIQQRLKSILKH